MTADNTPTPTPADGPQPAARPLSLQDTIRELSKRAADRGEMVVDVVISREEYLAAVRDNNVGDVLAWMIANPHAWETPTNPYYHDPIPSITFEGVSFYIRRADDQRQSAVVTCKPFPDDGAPAYWAMQVYPLTAP